jgi:MurNAc alpha-1-phosphate uridylyltransferase
MKAMVLAAGFGNRLRPLTDHTPKPLVTIGGKPLILHHLEKLSAAGYKDVVINLGHLGSKIPEALGNGSKWSLSIQYSDEGPEPLETGGGMAKALPFLGQDPFLLVNGDVWCDLDFSSIPQTLHPESLAKLYLVPKPAWRTRGDFALSGSLVCESESPEYLYSGIAIYHPKILKGAKVEKFSIVPRLKQAISEKKVEGILYSGEWDDVGTPERLGALREKFGT